MGGLNCVSIDIETTGLDWLKDRILCIGCSDGSYFSGATMLADFKTALKSFKNSNKILVWQNGSFDTKFLRNNGVIVDNEWDTMVAAYVLRKRPTRLSLDSLCSYYLGLPSWKGDIKDGAVFEDPALMRLYCLQDAENTEKLAQELFKRLKDEDRYDFFCKLMEARRMLTQAEEIGVLFDTAANTKLIAEYAQKVKQLDTALTTENPEAGVKNWNSPKQILALLKKLNLNTIHPLTKKDSADIRVLEQNKTKAKVVEQIIELRHNQKLLSMLEGYGEAVRIDGALHPNFNCTNTRTGRLSSSGDLNIQQVSQDTAIRSLFKARPGYKLVVGDLANIEPRLAAHYSKDTALCAMFNNEEDFYGTIAVQLLGADCVPNDVKAHYPDKRKLAKIIGLSVLYGIGINKLKNLMGEQGYLFTVDQVREIIRDYFEKFSGLKDLQRSVHQRVVDTGYLTNFFGRKVDVNEDEIHMTGVNSLIQSTASDYMLFKTIEFTDHIHQICEGHVKLLMLVHDEAVYEVQKGHEQQVAEELKKTMETATFRVPIVFDVFVGESWGCKK